MNIAEIVPSKPTISLDSKCLPEIKDWKVGKNYEITLKVHETGVHEDSYENKKILHATFEVLHAGAEESKIQEEEEDEEPRPKYGRAIRDWLARKDGNF